MEFKDMTPGIAGAAIDRHREIGPGRLESVDDRCREKEWTLDGYAVADLAFPAGAIVEIKSVDAIASIREAQLLNYMMPMELPIGLIPSFNVPVLIDGVKRMRI
jgi:hypothetical protein